MLTETNRKGEAAVNDLPGAGPAADRDDRCEKTDDRQGDRCCEYAATDPLSGHANDLAHHAKKDVLRPQTRSLKSALTISSPADCAAATGLAVAGDVEDRVAAGHRRLRIGETPND